MFKKKVRVILLITFAVFSVCFIVFSGVSSRENSQKELSYALPESVQYGFHSYLRSGSISELESAEALVKEATDLVGVGKVKSYQTNSANFVGCPRYISPSFPNHIFILYEEEFLAFQK